MECGSASTEFSINTFYVNSVEINIWGTCKFEVTLYEGNNPFNSLEGQEIVEGAVTQFVNILNRADEIRIDRIDFFGNIYIRDGKILNYPRYFSVLSRRICLYQILNAYENNVNYRLISTDDDYDNLIDRLNNIDNSATSYYYDCCNDEDDWEEDDINGDYEEDITDLMNGDICGNMYGNIKETMNGDIEGDMYGNIEGTMNGDIEGDMHGNIEGTMNGDIDGKFLGVITCDMYGDIDEN